MNGPVSFTFLKFEILFKNERRNSFLSVLPHLGESSSESEVRSTLVVRWSFRRTDPAAGGSGSGSSSSGCSAVGDMVAGGGSSSSSWVGCREQSRVSSVIQLRERGAEEVNKLLQTCSKHDGRSSKEEPPRDAAAPGHLGGLALQLGVGEAWGGVGRGGEGCPRGRCS